MNAITGKKFGINTIYTKLDGLLKKRPNYITLHVGTNDTENKSSEVILNDLLKLQNHIEQKAPEILVYLSCPINRVDNGKARITIQKLVEKIKHLKVKHLSNVNIRESCLGSKGLHLNKKRCGSFHL